MVRYEGSWSGQRWLGGGFGARSIVIHVAGHKVIFGEVVQVDHMAFSSLVF